MSFRIKHFLNFGCNDIQFQEIVKTIEKEPGYITDTTKATITTDSDQWTLYNFFAKPETKSIFFETIDEDPGAKITLYLSEKHRDIEICINSDGGYFGAYLCRLACINGHELYVEQYGVCDYRIHVPKDLGYDQGLYETTAFIPERICISRHNLDRIADYVLREAIRQSNQKDAAMYLLEDPGAYAGALTEARASIVKYAQFSSQTRQDTHKNILCDCKLDSSTKPFDDDDDDELPF